MMKHGVLRGCGERNIVCGIYCATCVADFTSAAEGKDVEKYIERMTTSLMELIKSI